MGLMEREHERRHDGDEQLAQAVLRLAHEFAVFNNEWHKSHSGFVTKQDLKQLEEKIMSAISEFATKQKAFNDRQAAAIDSAVTALTGLTGDIVELNRKITELQNSSGGVTVEDQKTIDELQVQGEAVATKAEALAAALQTLDSQTPPVVPPTP
jgi:hypothetical protein